MKFRHILLIVLFVAIVRHVNGISEQLRAFQRAIDDARMQLEGFRPASGSDDEELLRKRRRAIDSLLATFHNNADRAEQMESDGSYIRPSRDTREASDDGRDDTADRQNKEDIEEANKLADERTRILLDENGKDRELKKSIDLSKELTEVAKLNMKYKGVDSLPDSKDKDILRIMLKEPKVDDNVLDEANKYNENSIALNKKREVSNICDSAKNHVSKLDDKGDMRFEEMASFQKKIDTMEVGKIRDLIRNSETGAVSSDVSKESTVDSVSSTKSESLGSLCPNHLKDSTTSLAEVSSAEQNNSPLASSSLQNNDQDNTNANDYSHEANYKLSKMEQDASERKQPTSHEFFGKRSLSCSFNPMNEIKLKTASKLMSKGYGPSLPSYSLIDSVDYRRDSLIDDALKRVEQRIQKGQQHDEFDRVDQLISYEDAKRGSFLDTSNAGFMDDMKFHEINVDNAILNVEAAGIETNLNADNAKKFDDNLNENLFLRTKRLDDLDDEGSRSGVLKNAEELLKETQESAKKIKRLMQKNIELKASTKTLHDEVGKIRDIVDMNNQRIAQSKGGNDYDDASLEENGEAYEDSNEDANEVGSVYGSNEVKAAYKADEAGVAYAPDEARASFVPDEESPRYEAEEESPRYGADETGVGYASDEANAGYDASDTRAAYKEAEESAGYDADETRAYASVSSDGFDGMEFEEDKPRTRVKRIGFLDPTNAGKLLSVGVIEENALGSLEGMTMDRKKRASGQNLWESNDFDTIEMNEDEELHNRLKRQKFDELGYPYFNDRFRRSNEVGDVPNKQGKEIIKEPDKQMDETIQKAKREEEPKEVDEKIEKAKREEEPKEMAQIIDEQLKNNSATIHHRVKRFRRKRARSVALPNNATETDQNKANDSNEPIKERVQGANSTSNIEHSEESNTEKLILLKKEPSGNPITQLEAQDLSAENDSCLKPAPVRAIRKRRRTRRAVSAEQFIQPKQAMPNWTSLNTMPNATSNDTRASRHERNKRSVRSNYNANKLDRENEKPYDFNAIDADIADLRAREKHRAQQQFDFGSAASEFGNQEFDNIKQSVPKMSNFRGMTFDNLKNNRYFKNFDQNGDGRGSKLKFGKTTKRDNIDHGEVIFDQINQNAPSNSNGDVPGNDQGRGGGNSLDNGGVTFDCKISQKVPANSNANSPGNNQRNGVGNSEGKSQENVNLKAPTVNIFNKSGNTTEGVDRALVIALRDELLNCTAFGRLEGFLKAMSPKLSDFINKTVSLKEETPAVKKSDDFRNSMEKVKIAEQPQRNFPSPLFSTGKGLGSGSQPEMADKTDASGTPDKESDKNKEQGKNTAKVVGESGKNSDDTVKLNITINASVMGSEQANNFFGNGTIRVLHGSNTQEYRVPRSTLDYEHGVKHKCGSRRGKPKCRPTPSCMNTDKLSAQVVDTMFGMVRSNPQLQVLWPNLKHNEQLKNSAKHQCKTNFASVRCKENEGQIQRTEQLLKRAMETINDLIEEQVRTRTCVPLRPDLRDFYELILQTHAENQQAREKRESKFTAGNDFSKLVRELDPSKIDERSRIVKKLLSQYDELPREDQQEVASIREDLLKNLIYLRKLKDSQDSIRRRKREGEVAESMQPNKAGEAPLVKKLEAEFTPAYLKLLKTSELFREAASEAEQC